MPPSEMAQVEKEVRVPEMEMQRKGREALGGGVTQNALLLPRAGHQCHKPCPQSQLEETDGGRIQCKDPSFGIRAKLTSHLVKHMPLADHVAFHGFSVLNLGFLILKMGLIRPIVRRIV